MLTARIQSSYLVKWARRDHQFLQSDRARHSNDAFFSILIRLFAFSPRFENGSRSLESGAWVSQSRREYVSQAENDPNRKVRLLRIVSNMKKEELFLTIIIGT